MMQLQTLSGSRLTGLTSWKAPGFWMIEHQLVYYFIGLNIPMKFIENTHSSFSLLKYSFITT